MGRVGHNLKSGRFVSLHACTPYRMRPRDTLANGRQFQQEIAFQQERQRERFTMSVQSAMAFEDESGFVSRPLYKNAERMILVIQKADRGATFSAVYQFWLPCA